MEVDRTVADADADDIRKTKIISNQGRWSLIGHAIKMVKAAKEAMDACSRSTTKCIWGHQVQ
jgi:hypothetical protein